MTNVRNHFLQRDHEGETPGMFIVELDDERLLAVDDGFCGHVSEDLGRNWSKPFRFLQEGRPLGAELNQRPAYGSSSRRLSDGKLGMA